MTAIKDDAASSMTFSKDDGTDGMPETLKESPIGALHGIAAIALNMALKYHDINTVQDGLLYQQYKLEGRNMRDLQLDVVFHTAVQIEEHMIGANARIAKLLIAGILSDSTDEDETDQENVEPEPEITSP